MPTFTNQATLSYNNITTNSNVVTGQLLEVLSVTKTAVMNTYSAQEVVTYVVSILNTGTTALTGLTATDDLGAYIQGGVTRYPLDYLAGSVRLYINGVLQAPPAATAEPPLVITGINIPAGGNAILVYEEHAETVLCLHRCCCWDYKNLIVRCGDNDVSCAAAVQQTILVVKDGTELYATCVAVNNTADAFHTTLLFVSRTVNQC